MATNLTVSSNYNGTVAGEIIGKAFKEADTIAKNLVTVLPDIDFKVSLRKIQYSDGRTDFTCGFQPKGSVVLSERVLEPKKIKNEQEICKEDLRQIWSSATMGFSAHNDTVPADVESALLTEILADTAESTDADIWQGDETIDGEFDGFIKTFDADAAIIKAGSGITSLTAPITKSNVISEIQKVRAAIPIALRRKTDLIFAFGPDILNAYEDALIDPTIASGFGASGQDISYGSQKFEVINGLPDNTFVVYQRKNLHFGTGLLSDHNEIKIADGDEFGRLDGQVRYKMVYTAGVQYVNSEEIIWYLTTT